MDNLKERQTLHWTIVVVKKRYPEKRNCLVIAAEPSPTCRMGKQKDEMVLDIVSGCQKLA